MGPGYRGPRGLGAALAIDSLGGAATLRGMPLPRKFLNEDEELLVELRPHWVFFAGPLARRRGRGGGGHRHPRPPCPCPDWAADALLILAAIPVLWSSVGSSVGGCYTLALTTTRIVVRRGVSRQGHVQIRLQRITEICLSQKLWERMLATGRLLIDVQGEDDAVVLEFIRKPAIVQRVINGQINELTAGALAEADSRRATRASTLAGRGTRERPGPDEAGRHAAVRCASRRGRNDRALPAAQAACRPPPPATHPPRPAPAPADGRPLARRQAPARARFATGSSSSTTCASGGSSPRRSSRPRRPSS